MPTIQLNQDNYERLSVLVGKLQVKKKCSVSINEVITGILNLTEKAIIEECLKVE